STLFPYTTLFRSLGYAPHPWLYRPRRRSLIPCSRRRALFLPSPPAPAPVSLRRYCRGAWLLPAPARKFQKRERAKRCRATPQKKSARVLVFALERERPCQFLKRNDSINRGSRTGKVDVFP